MFGKRLSPGFLPGVGRDFDLFGHRLFFRTHFSFVEKMELARVLLHRAFFRTAPEELVLKEPQPFLQEFDAGFIPLLLVEKRRFLISDDRFEQFKIIG
jgi:hypothetical protein